jgi:hypothetical protein
MKPTVSILVFAAAACASPVSPTSSGHITLRVINTTATPLRIAGYPDLHPAIPQPLGGVVRLGVVAGFGSVCLVFPDSISIRVVGGGTTGTTTWSTASSFTVTALDTINTLNEVGQTSAFIPNSAAGWSVTMPNNGNAPVSSATCTP